MSASGLCGNEAMKEILQYLKKHGERLDTDIAEATGISLATVHLQLAELVAKCEVVACHSIRFKKDKKIEGTIYRIAGYTPPASPGRKSKAQLKLS
jgi:DeoR/GlpR family transcriptional regulator of sugar metabolism